MFIETNEKKILFFFFSLIFNTLIFFII